MIPDVDWISSQISNIKSYMLLKIYSSRDISCNCLGDKLSLEKSWSVDGDTGKEDDQSVSQDS